VDNPTHYEVLGIARDAAMNEVTRAFRRRSLETHPDKNPGDQQAAARFIAVVRAYEVLSDVHRRAAYDVMTLGSVAGCSRYGLTLTDVLEAEFHSVMDTPADDVLEEYVVGNVPPADATLGTFFRDLERTEVFILLREGKAAFFESRFPIACELLERLVQLNPHNILGNYYLGLASYEVGRRRRAFAVLRSALAEGLRRIPQKTCPGVRRALYGFYRRSWRFWSAWWLVRSTPDLLFDDPLGYVKREQLRIKRLMLETTLRPESDAPSRFRALPAPRVAPTPSDGERNSSTDRGHQ
jgi:curved DNA-binding protein CbpA